jgi:hypothetical protein
MGLIDVLSRKSGVIVGDDVLKLFQYARENQFAVPAIVSPIFSADVENKLELALLAGISGGACASLVNGGLTAVAFEHMYRTSPHPPLSLLLSRPLVMPKPPSSSSSPRVVLPTSPAR